MQVRTAVYVAIAAIALVSATGCKALEERFTPPPKVVTEEATVAVDGAAVQGELSEDTPQGLPIWPGATVTESTGTEDAYGLSLTTTDPFDDVLNGTAVGFEEAGFEVAREEAGVEGARSVVLTVSGDGLEGFVTLTEIGDGTTQIDYAVTTVQ